MSFTILLVEDNEADAELLTEFLTAADSPPSLYLVHDGYEALDYIFRRKQYRQATRPDLLLLDLNLPRISGYEVLKEIKDDAALAGIPVIILTTSLHPFDHDQCRALGADISLPKPQNLAGYKELAQQLIKWSELRWKKQA